MPSTMSTSMASLLLLSTFVQGAVIERATCVATTNWPGWPRVKHAFVFGDSYTQTGFNETQTQPTPTNPMGNPPYPGWTSSNGPNWIDYLTYSSNSSLLLTYNLAYGGATIDSTLVAPYKPQVSSISNQVKDLWYPAYASRPTTAPWTGKDSIFAFWDGVNDVGNSWWLDTATLYPKIFTVWRGLLDSLYKEGARNFVFLNTPPVDRSPLALTNDAASQKSEKDAIAYWNELLTNMTRTFKVENKDINVFGVDTNGLFTSVLDNPASFKETRGLKNVTGYCDAYSNGTPAQDTMIASCGVPVNQYFWLNSLHPTSPMHEVVALGVANQMKMGPNIC